MYNKSVIWERFSLPKDYFNRISKANDTIAILHLMLHLLCIFLSAVLVSYLFLKHYYYFLPFALFIHGMILTFLGWEGASHELSHNTVFKSHFVNKLFLIIFSFLTWNNFTYFVESHKRHHLFTLHENEDCEYNFYAKPKLIDFIWESTFNFPFFFRRLRVLTENSFGIVRGHWAEYFFGKEKPNKRIRLINNSRFILIGHCCLFFIFLKLCLYHLIFCITLAPFFGNIVPRILGRAQHYGMSYNSSDFRECCRTITLPAFLEFFYWGMNYHVEHHMYPSIPFYNLRKLSYDLHDWKYLQGKNEGFFPLFTKIFHLI